MQQAVVHPDASRKIKPLEDVSRVKIRAEQAEREVSAPLDMVASDAAPRRVDVLEGDPPGSPRVLQRGIKFPDSRRQVRADHMVQCLGEFPRHARGQGGMFPDAPFKPTCNLHARGRIIDAEAPREAPLREVGRALRGVEMDGASIKRAKQSVHMYMLCAGGRIQPGEPGKMGWFDATCAQMLIDFVSPVWRGECFITGQAQGDMKEPDVAMMAVGLEMFVRCIRVSDENRAGQDSGRFREIFFHRPGRAMESQISPHFNLPPVAGGAERISLRLQASVRVLHRGDLPWRTDRGSRAVSVPCR